MIFLSEQQLSKKYNSLPINLRDVLDSSDIGNIVSRICEQQHLSSEKTEIINNIVAEIILGLIHAEDLSKEIQLNISLDKRIADVIADEINKKIFSPIKEDLIKNYFPLEEEAYSSSPEVAMLISESRKIISEVQQEKKEQNELVDLRIIEKKKSEEEIKKPIEIKKELPAVPFPIEAISKIKTVPSVVKAIEDKPVIIHKEMETKPILGKQRSLGGLFGFLKAYKEGEKIQEQKPIRAEVEMPILELPKPPKVVHYSDLKTSVSMPIPLIPKPFDVVKQEKPELKSKVFESEIEKAKAAGLIVNNHQLITSDQQFKIEEIPIEIEEIPTQSFFSKILQSFISLFVTKKKIVREVSDKPIIDSLQSTTIKMPEKVKDFAFPLEIKLPTPLQKESELPKLEIPELKTDIFKTKEIEPPEIHEIREKPQPIMPQPVLNIIESEKQDTHNEEIIDLRTFQRIRK